MGVSAKDTRFLRKLYLILGTEDASIISWSTDGKAFSVHNTAALQRLMKSKYNLSSMCTFRQNLRAHGFTEIEYPRQALRSQEGTQQHRFDGSSSTRAAPETYYHKFFVRGRPGDLEKIGFDASEKFRCHRCRRQPNEAGTKCFAYTLRVQASCEASSTAPSIAETESSAYCRATPGSSSPASVDQRFTSMDRVSSVLELQLPVSVRKRAFTATPANQASVSTTCKSRGTKRPSGRSSSLHEERKAGGKRIRAERSTETSKTGSAGDVLETHIAVKLIPRVGRTLCSRRSDDPTPLIQLPSGDFFQPFELSGFLFRAMDSINVDRSTASGSANRLPPLADVLAWRSSAEVH